LLNQLIYLRSLGMKIKNTLVPLLAAALVGTALILSRSFSHKEMVAEERTSHKIIKIAVCPTFYKVVANSDEAIAVKTGSTAGSLDLLAKGEVDYVLAGRILKPGESSFPYEIIGGGYSFLASKEKTITEEGLRKYNVYTDIDVEEVSQIFDLDNVYYVNDVYNYLEKGIIITSWNNTDYLRAETVHLVDENGNHVPKSRLPILFCASECDDGIVNKLKTNLTFI
jgi:hypothetical protein